MAATPQRIRQRTDDQALVAETAEAVRYLPDNVQKVVLMACTSACPTPGAHATWGECRRALGMRIAYCQSADGRDATRQKKWDRELNAYEDARAGGLQPNGTSMEKVTQAVEAYEKRPSQNNTGVI